MSPSALGRVAAGNSDLFFRLRDGLDVHMRTVERATE
jgi:hypothetical protein